MKKLTFNELLIKIEKQLIDVEIEPNEDYFNEDLYKCILLIDVLHFIKTGKTSDINKFILFFDKKFTKKSSLNDLPF